jgi:hypothetical protein
LESRVNGDQPEDQQDDEDGNHEACLVEDSHRPARTSAIARRQPSLCHCKSHTTARAPRIEALTAWKQRAMEQCAQAAEPAPQGRCLWCASTVRRANRHIPRLRRTFAPSEPPLLPGIPPTAVRVILPDSFPVTGASRRPLHHPRAHAGTARPASCR